ncbi:MULTISPECIES: MarR family winged helix-turn-helix transcriptional regulator [Brevibacillus]|uniref:Putative HTH-type transcriptional regulator YdgJ n=1 Tax=Brevibacillus parabrevis TaxID=54914 RepID=A0A4Y3PQR3_BREPA|nr:MULTISPECIES: MarR family transcriptional regulator [Brevibacillus]MBU8711275.1 MarR family transcriptional regulator [Brevibacillus parabrevis]MDH6350109.1 DNA-binding MarR family transcriptional regulator [Brevibacillus sp. 1238]MDR4999551.1 MarR family transcriptional regulator [Brevibacillus parabrevis]MED1721591.1 MarR family transcriptional regulator [Brevibacillus parabrevis]NRQ53779.1 MarR family transcriptional regulator [Brevibacillus sp. HD1.4A]
MTYKEFEEEQILSLLIGLTNKISPKFERCTGISSTRLAILQMLCERSEINQSQLQKHIDIDGAAITRHLKQLEADGMVIRYKNPNDNRETFVRLSDEGIERIEGYKSEKRIFIQQILAGFSEEETRVLADFLKRMQNNI